MQAKPKIKPAVRRYVPRRDLPGEGNRKAGSGPMFLKGSLTYNGLIEMDFFGGAVFWPGRSAGKSFSSSLTSGPGLGLWGGCYL